MAVLKMSRPNTRPNSTALQYRKKLPADLRGRFSGVPIVVEFPTMGTEPAHTAVATIGNSAVGFSLRTTNAAVAKARNAQAIALVERTLTALQAGPIALTQRQTAALAGEVYRKFISTHEENPATPEVWAAMKGVNRAVDEGRLSGRVPALALADVEAHKTHALALLGADAGAALTAAIDAKPRSNAVNLEERYGGLANYVLALHGLIIDGPSRTRLLVQIAGRATQAALRLKANAVGDYGPDAVAAAIPPLEGIKGAATRAGTRAGKGPSWDALLKTWADRHVQGDGSARTGHNWQQHMRKFAAFVKVRPVDVTAVHVRAWVADRLNGTATAGTIAKRDLPILKAFFTCGIGAGLFPADYVHPTAAVQAPRQSPIKRVLSDISARETISAP